MKKGMYLRACIVLQLDEKAKCKQKDVLDYEQQKIDMVRKVLKDTVKDYLGVQVKNGSNKVDGKTVLQLIKTQVNEDDYVSYSQLFNSIFSLILSTITVVFAGFSMIMSGNKIEVSYIWLIIMFGVYLLAIILYAVIRWRFEKKYESSMIWKPYLLLVIEEMEQSFT